MADVAWLRRRPERYGAETLAHLDSHRHVNKTNNYILFKLLIQQIQQTFSKRALRVQPTLLSFSLRPEIKEQPQLKKYTRFRKDSLSMQKLPVKKLLLMSGILALALLAFIAGGIVISSAQAASSKAPDKSTSPSKCDKNDLKCKGDSPPDPTNQTKAIVVVNSVAGNTIHATYVEQSDKKTNTVTITTTASTIYKPDASVVAVGKTIFVGGTLNKDGSITAQVVGSYDPTADKFSGVVTKINGSTITIQVKDRTSTIHVTNSTTFFKVQPKTKETQPAARKDLKVGENIEAQGKLNGDGSLTAKTVTIVPGDVVAK
jgi:hypothetical protein